MASDLSSLCRLCGHFLLQNTNIIAYGNIIMTFYYSVLTHTNDIYTLSSQSGIKDLIKPTTFNYNGILEMRSFDPINMIVFVKYF